jgi:hypothetical protein
MVKAPRPAALDSARGLAGGGEAVFRRSPAAGAAHGSKVALVLIAGRAPPEPVVLTQLKRPARLAHLFLGFGAATFATWDRLSLFRDYEVSVSFDLTALPDRFELGCRGSGWLPRVAICS